MFCHHFLENEELNHLSKSPIYIFLKDQSWGFTYYFFEIVIDLFNQERDNPLRGLHILLFIIWAEFHELQLKQVMFVEKRK